MNERDRRADSVREPGNTPAEPRLPRIIDQNPTQDVWDSLQISRASSLGRAFSQLADAIRSAQPKKHGDKYRVD